MADIATLELENKMLRERNARLEEENLDLREELKTWLQQRQVVTRTKAMLAERKF